jgi:WD40 repeat protein
MSFRSDNRFLATTIGGLFVDIWDAASGELVQQLTCRRGGNAWDASFSPSRALLAVVCLDEVVVFNASSATPSKWKPVTRFGRTLNAPFEARFSPDSELLVVMNANNTARVIGTDTWRQSTTLALPPPNAYSFSPRDDLLVAVDDKGVPRAWDLVSGQRLALFGEVRNQVADISFTSDGRFVFVASGNGDVDRYPCDVCGSVDELQKRAEARTTRPLTAEERSIFLHEG